MVAVVAQVFAKKERIPEQGGANRNTNSVCKHTYSVKSPLNHKELRVIGLFFASLVCHRHIICRYRLS